MERGDEEARSTHAAGSMPEAFPLTFLAIGLKAPHLVKLHGMANPRLLELDLSPFQGEDGRSMLRRHLPEDLDWVEDLFEDRLSHDVPRELAWKPRNGPTLQLEAWRISAPSKAEVLVAFIDVTRRSDRLDALEATVSALNQAERIAGLGSFVWDLCDDSLRWSENMFAIAGMSGDGVVGKHAQVSRQLIVEEDFARVAAQIEEMRSSRQTWPLSFRIRRPDGAIRWLRSSCQLFFGKEGRPERCVGVHLDVTDEQRGKETLLAHEATFASTFEHAGTGMAMVDLDGTFLVVNPALCSLLGRSAEELEGRALADVTHPDEVARCREDFEALLRGDGDHYRQEKRYVHRDGSVIHAILTVTLLRLPSGEPSHAVAELVDLTERHEMEKRLRNREQRFRSLFDALPLGAVLVGPGTGVILECNDACAELMGYERPELLGRTLFDLTHPEDLEHVRTALRQFFLDAPTRVEALELEQRILRRDGSERRVRVVASPIRVEEDGGFLCQALLEDVTLRRKEEERQRMMGDRIREAQKLESLGVLAGGIAHDFNNILMAILGNADMARLDVPEGSSLRGCLEEIVEASHRAAELCRQMLAYSGRGHFVLGPVDLNTVVTELRELIAVTLPKGTDLLLKLRDDLPSIVGDAKQMGQLLLTLVSNAAEALEGREGTIEIETGRRRFDEGDLIGALGHPDPAPGDWVMLSVRDDGCGMDENTRSKAFEPFFSTKFTGRGLGLAALIGIVRGHEGLVLVESEVDEGTTMRCLFPLRDASPKEKPFAVSEAPSRDAILLVDDEETVRTVARRMLERLGWKVYLACDGVEALEIEEARRDEIAAVLMDLTMPRMDGVETRSRMLARNPEQLVILSTGYDAAEARKRFEGNPADQVIQKPYRLETLRSYLEKIIPWKPRPRAGR